MSSLLSPLQAINLPNKGQPHPKPEGTSSGSPNIIIGGIHIIKTSPKQFLSPQCKNSKKNLEPLSSAFSPLIRNRVITTPNVHHSPRLIKEGETENTQNQFLSPKESGNSSLFHHFSPSNKSQTPSIQKRLEHLTMLTNLQREDNQCSISNISERKIIVLPSIQTKKAFETKSRLSLLDQKPSFFDEINKYARKSFLVPEQNSSQSENSIKTGENFQENLPQCSQIFKIQEKNLQQSHTLNLIIQQSNLQIPSIGSLSQLDQNGNIPPNSADNKGRKSIQFPQSPLSVKSFNSDKTNTNFFKPKRSIFMNEGMKDHGSNEFAWNQITENLQQTKENGNTFSESSEGDSKSSNSDQKQKEEQISIKLLPKQQKNKFLTPQLQSQALAKRNRKELTPEKAKGIEFLRTFSNNKKEVNPQESNNYLSMNLLRDNGSILRELQYLSPDMKKYVCDEVDSNNELKRSILSFCMMDDMQEFSFYFGQFLDHIFEERILKDTNCTFKLPVSLFSKLERLMIQFMEKEQKSNHLKQLFKYQLTKNNYIISSSSLLEALGGYIKLKNICKQFASLLLASTLQSFININDEEEVSNKIYEFISASLQNEVDKAASLIHQLKKSTWTQPTRSEYFVLKKVLFSFFKKRPYYSKEVRDQFFELLEAYRYFFTTEDGFTAQFLQDNKSSILAELMSQIKLDPKFKLFQETSKGQLQIFIQELFLFIFSQRNCIEFQASFNSSFVNQQLDLEYVTRLRQIVLTMARKQGIRQLAIMKNFSYSFEKLQWLVQKGENNIVEVIGNTNDIEESMILMINNQKNMKKVHIHDTNNEDCESSEGHQSHASQTEKCKGNKVVMNHNIDSSTMNDISNFSEFLTMYFNFHTTYHYSDLLCFYSSEKKRNEVFIYWTGVISESLMEVRKISKQKADQIKDYIVHLFESQNS